MKTIKKSKETLMKIIGKEKDPLLVFDAICVRNYFAGSLGQNIPVDESREVFEYLKKLLKSNETN